MKNLIIKIIIGSLVLLQTAGCRSEKDRTSDPENNLFSDRYIKEVMEETTFWQLEHPLHELWHWSSAIFYAGVYAAYETTGSTEMWDALMEMGETNEWKPGPRLFKTEDIGICMTYVDLYRIEKDPKMIQPFIDRLDEFMSTPYHVKLPFKSIWWWWVDALVVGPPGIVKLGVTLDEKKYLEVNDKRFKETYDLLFDEEENLFARDSRYKWDQDIILKESNGKKIFWSRGNGWALAGLTWVLEELPADYENRDFYEGLFLKLANRIKSLQPEDGLWRVSLLDPEAYPDGEASGTGLITYALAWGINQGLLDKKEFLPVVEKAWIGLNGLIQADGRVGWTQPVGTDPQSNFSAESFEMYGTGAFLLAGSEVIKIEW